MDRLVARVDVGQLCPVYLQTPRADNGRPRYFIVTIPLPKVDSGFTYVSVTCPLAHDTSVRGTLAPTGIDRARSSGEGDRVEAEILCAGCQLHPQRFVMSASPTVTTRT